MSRAVRVGVVVGLVLALALSAACAQIAEKAARGAVEKATGVKVDEANNKVTVTGKNGETASFSGGDGKLPENIPADFPVYQGTPVSGAAAEGSEGKTWTFTITTSDPVKTVFEWYKAALDKADWSIENSMTVTVNGSDSATLSAKKDLKEATVQIGGDQSKGDQTSLFVIVHEKAKQ